jgi:hypothetical protein
MEIDQFFFAGVSWHFGGWLMNYTDIGTLLLVNAVTFGASILDASREINFLTRNAPPKTNLLCLIRGGNQVSQQKQEYTYRSLLKENKSFRNLFYALSVSTLGDWFYHVALMGLMYASTQSPFMVSLILLSGALPRLLFSPLAGAFIDRFNRKKIMVLTDFIRGTLILFMIPLADHLVSLFMIVILNSIAGIFFNPSRQAVLPNIMKKEQLAAANSLSNVVYGITGVMGASLGGVVTAFFT